MCGVFALTEDDQTFHILSDGYYIDPPCSIYLTGVNRINNIYRLSGMCFKMSDVLLPCGRNDTIIIRGWALQIFNQTQSVSLYTNQSMVGICKLQSSSSYNYLQVILKKIHILKI